MLEGPGHEKRTSRLRRAFQRNTKPIRRHGRIRWLLWRARDLGLVCLGAAIGAVGMVAVDYSGLSEMKKPVPFASVYYANCREVIQAGVAPILFGQPGYRPPLDADGDGVACEPYRRW